MDSIVFSIKFMIDQMFNYKVIEMKTYKSIQEWLSSNPSKESQDKILLTINRNVQSEGQRQIKVKQKSLKELR